MINGRIVGLIFPITMSFLAFPTTVRNETAQMGYYQRNTEYVLQNAAKLVRPVLSADERRIQSSVRLWVPAVVAVVAQAYPGNIAISAGFASILEQLAVSHFADHELGLDGCDEAYTLYVAQRIADNTERVARGRKPQLIYGAELYGRHFGGPCENLRLQDIKESDNSEYLATLVEASLMFLYLHELGHHVNGHVDNLPLELNYSRRAEAEADAWAIDVAFRAGYQVLAAAPMLNLLAALGGASLEAERKRTHPRGIRRVRELLLEARNVLIKQGNDKAVRRLDENLTRAKTLSSD